MLVRQVNPMQEAMSMLDQMEYLDESFGSSAYLVPVRHNYRLDKDLIQLESFVDYANQNGIQDAGYAIANICEACNITADKIGFSVNDYSLYADEGILETAQLMQENGYLIATSQVPSESVWYKSLEEALELDKDCSLYEESPHLVAYCESAYLNENVFEDVSNAVSKKARGAYNWVSNKASSNYKAAKKTLSSGVDSLSKKLSALKKKAIELKTAAAKQVGAAKAFTLKQLNKVEDGIKWCKKKLIAGKDAAAKAASNAKGKVIGGANTIKNKAFSLADNGSKMASRGFNAAKKKFSFK